MTPDDDKLRAMWRALGGKFHGPKIETAYIEEEKLLPFLADIVEILDIAETSSTDLFKVTKSLIADDSIDAAAFYKDMELVQKIAELLK